MLHRRTTFLTHLAALSAALFSVTSVHAQESDSLALQRLRNENFRLRLQVRNLQDRLERLGSTTGISSLDSPMDASGDTYSILDNWDDLTTRDVRRAERPASTVAAVDTLLRIPDDDALRKYLDIYTTRRRKAMVRILSRYDKLESMIKETFRRHGVPEDFAPLCIVESAATGNAISRAGAAGLWQLMPDTAKGLGMTVTLLRDDRFDPVASTDVAARYLRKLHDRLGDWGLALMAYNCGPGGVLKALDRTGGDRSYEAVYRAVPRETRDYLPALVAVMFVNANRELIYGDQ